MSPQTHERPAEGGLSSSFLPPVNDTSGTESLRSILSSFNHRCRNSLNGIKLGLYLYKREVDGPMPVCWLELERAYQELETMFDRLQVLYRPLCLTVVRSPLGHLIDEHLPSWRSWLSLRGRTLDLRPPAEDLPGDFDPMYLGLGLDALVAWRSDSGDANAKLRLSWRTVDGFIEVTWEEGRTANGLLDPAYESGRRLGSSSLGEVDSLAHPLLARIIAAHGGFLEATSEPAFAMRLRWPRFQVCEPSE